MAAHPRVTVPPEVMQRLLVHRVDPTYPENAAKDRVSGIVVLDAVIGADGSVMSLHPASGPVSLAQAAMDSVQWWKFQPYRVNGRAVEVESTLAIEFR